MCVAASRCVRHENLRLRTFHFSVACIRAASKLVRDPLGQHLVGQLIRSGGGVGANYNSACHAKSRPDFAAKVTIVAEEAAEAVFWFEVFVAVDLMADVEARPLILEGRELTAIAIASAKTARRRKKEEDDEP
jgi:four helix bundle protein